MQQTKRRSKKGVILLALAVALLVLAFVPAAMAANNTLTSTLALSPAGTPGQAGVNWVNNIAIGGTFDALYNGGALPSGLTVHGTAYWVDGGAGQFVPGNPATVMNFGLVGDGVHTIISTPDTTQTGTPPDPNEPATTTQIGVDRVDPVWSWTLSPADPGGVLNSPDPAQWYGNVPVTFLATASDPGGSGVAAASASWTNLTTSTDFPNSPPNVINQPGYATDGNPFVWETTGTVTAPAVSPTEPSLGNTAAYSTTVYLTATDVAGNTSDDASFTINHDVWAPVTTRVVTPVGADSFAGYTNQPVTVKFLATDNLSGVAYTEYITKTSTTTVPPATPALTDSGTKGTSVTITQSAPVGPVYLYYRSVDKAVPANLEQWHVARIFIDTSAPTVTVTGPSWWIDSATANLNSGPLQPFYFTLSASDPNSGLAPAGLQFKMPTWGYPLFPMTTFPYADWTSYSGNGILLWLQRATHVSDGIFPLSYTASDLAGNTATGSANVKIDTRPPATSGANGWVNGLKPYTLTATDQSTGAGVAATIYRVDQSTPWAASVDSTPTVSFDTSIPWVNPVQGATHTIDFGSVDAALPVNYDPTMAPYWNSVDGVLPSYNWGNSEFSSWVVTGGSQREVVWSNVTGYKTNTVKLDITPPTVTAMDPKNGNWQTGPATINFTGSDVGSGYAYTEWSTDGGTTWHSGETASIGGNGVITVTYHGVDMVGLKSADQTIQVKVASTGPSVTGGNVSVKKGHSAHFRFNVTSVTPSARVSIQIRTKSGQTVSTHSYANVMTGSSQTRSFMVNLKKGKYNIRISAVDQAGNSQTQRGTGTLTVK
jgi:hypothetical protein